MGHLVLNYGAQRVEVLLCVIHSENISLLFESDEIAEKTASFAKRFRITPQPF